MIIVFDLLLLPLLLLRLLLLHLRLLLLILIMLLHFSFFFFVVLYTKVSKCFPFLSLQLELLHFLCANKAKHLSSVQKLGWNLFFSPCLFFYLLCFLCARVLGVIKAEREWDREIERDIHKRERDS